MLKPVLPTSNEQNLLRSVRRTCILILGLKGLKSITQLVLHVDRKLDWTLIAGFTPASVAPPYYLNFTCKRKTLIHR